MRERREGASERERDKEIKEGVKAMRGKGRDDF